MSTPANSLNISQTGLVNFDGTATFTGVTVTQHDLLVGAASNSITSVAPSATSGVPVISQGAAADPTFGTAVVAGGGTGRTTLTNHGVLVGAGTTAITQLAAGSAGQVLQSGGASADPAYSTATYPSTAGTAGNILKSDGTNFVSSSPASSGASWVLIQSQPASNSTSISFTTGITSTYNTYVFLISNVVPASSGSSLNMQFSSTGGSSYINSGYQSGVTTTAYNSTTVANTNSTSQLRITGGINTSGLGLASANFTIQNVTVGANITWCGTGMYNNGNNVAALTLIAGGLTNSSVINAFQFSMSSGNISSGTFTLYGILE